MESVTSHIKTFPFTAIAGQEDMKKALILNAVNPMLGGVLIRGEKGTAKSTAVRALIDILPDYEAMDCRFNCNPNDKSQCCEECVKKLEDRDVEVKNAKMKVVNLPVSATEDRVVGTLDIEQAIKTGEKHFESGILANANRNILYVDEVNLLEDHIVDLLLDSAAMGVNIVEREGISFVHPAKFILVGTMNPEEGDLRPQLLDRFGLVVDVVGESELEIRKQVVRRRLDFESNPDLFIQQFQGEQEKLKNRIINAKQLLNKVDIDDDMLTIASKVAIEMEVDGHRSDINIIKTAITNAAFEGRDKVLKNDILLAAKYVLPHRIRRAPFEEGSLDFDRIEKAINCSHKDN